MYLVIPTLVVLILVVILLFPEPVQKVMMFRVTPAARPDPNNIGMRMVPTAGLFVFGFAMLQAWDRALNRSKAHVHDPLQLRLLPLGAIAFLGFGIFECIWPMRFMEWFVPALRGKTANLDAPDSRKVALIGKCFGVISLLVSVFLFWQSFS